MLYFCTYFDSNYLAKGLTLYRSLVRHAAPFRLWVLCFDDLVCEILKKLALPEIIPIFLGDFEKEDKELLRVKDNRSRIEYYFTSTAPFVLFVLRNYPEIDVIAYVDADLFFFSDPAGVYKELGDNSVLIVGHRFPPRLKHMEAHGIYNVSLLLFRRDNIALECLQWWRERCLEWCYDRVEDGRFADQKYLDDWPGRFPGIATLRHKGAGLAPWNLENYSLSLQNAQVAVDSEPLVFFHFHGLKRISRWLYDTGVISYYGVQVNSLIKQHIYARYFRELEEVARWISVSFFANEPHIYMGSIRNCAYQADQKKSVFYRLARGIKRGLLIARGILQGRLWVFFK